MPLQSPQIPHLRYLYSFIHSPEAAVTSGCHIGVISGLYRHDVKENGNYYIIIGYIKGLLSVFIS